MNVTLLDAILLSCLRIGDVSSTAQLVAFNFLELLRRRRVHHWFPKAVALAFRHYFVVDCGIGVA